MSERLKFVVAKSLADSSEIKRLQGVNLELSVEQASTKNKLLDAEAEVERLTRALKSSEERTSSLEVQLGDKAKEIHGKEEECKHLAVELTKKVDDLKAKDELLQAKDSGFEKEKEELMDDFLQQFTDARNIYFLEGWEAAMGKAGVEITSEVFKNVPWLYPDEKIPKFSFEKPVPSTPSEPVVLSPDPELPSENPQDASTDIASTSGKDDPKSAPEGTEQSNIVDAFVEV